jgi:hypothetical protein
MKISRIVLLALVCSVMTAGEAFSRGGGGGGGRGGGGGGGARPGGFSGGGGARPSPSMSRAAPPSAPRPQMSSGANRPSSPGQGRPSSFGDNRASSFGEGRGSSFGDRDTSMLGRSPSIPQPPRAPSAGDMSRFGGGNASRFESAGQLNQRSAQSFERPNTSELNSFLHMPGGAAGAQSAGRVGAAKPSTASTNSSPNFNSKSYTTDRGTTITVGGGKGSGTTAGGANVAGGAAGVKVEGAGGNTYVKGTGGVAGSKDGVTGVAGGSAKGFETASGAGGVQASGFRGVTDGTNSAVRAGSVTAGRDAQGNAVANVRGGYADSSGYRQGGSLTAARNQWGYAGAVARGGYGYRNGTGQVGAIGGIRGPAGNVVTAGRGASFVNGQFVGGQAWSAVNGAYRHWGYYSPGWYAGYPGAWWPGRWAYATTAWAAATWATAGTYCGCTGDGAYYDYGGNVTYDDGNVYYDNEPVATAEQYYDQAGQLADAGAAATSDPAATTDDQWLPLGVFAVVSEPTQTQTDKTVQLAVNQDGVIRGNLHDDLSDKVVPIVGSVDKTTQRVALKLDAGDSPIVVETGLYNLTNDEVPVLVHFSADRQEPRTLIRLKQPDDAQQPAAQTPSDR